MVTDFISNDELVSRLKLKKEHSKKNYLFALSDFMTVTGLDSFINVSLNDVLKYCSVLEQRVSAGDYTVTTRNVRIYQLKSLFDATCSNSDNPFSHIIINEPFNEHTGAKISIDDMKKILDILPFDLQIAVRLAAECALTLSEIINLTTNNIGHSMITVYGTGGFKRIISIPDDLMKNLKTLAGCSFNGRDIFFTSRNTPANARWFQRNLAKFTSYTFQDFRVYALTHIILMGATEQQWKSYTGMLFHYNDYSLHLYYASESAFSYECVFADYKKGSNSSPVAM